MRHAHPSGAEIRRRLEDKQNHNLIYQVSIRRQGRGGSALAYIAFRRKIVSDHIPAFTCVVGTLAQEVHATAPEIRGAALASIFGHSGPLQAHIQAAIETRVIMPDRWDAASLACHFPAMPQGGFTLAKFDNNRDRNLEAIDHLDRHAHGLFLVPSSEHTSRAV